jgi:hypothetical protein
MARTVALVLGPDEPDESNGDVPIAWDQARERPSARTHPVRSCISKGSISQVAARALQSAKSRAAVGDGERPATSALQASGETLSE